MLNKNELINILKEKNINYFEAKRDVSNSNLIENIELIDLDEFIRFTKSNFIKNVYLKSEYYSMERYLIQEYVIERAYIKFYEKVYEEILESNTDLIPPEDTNLSIGDEILIKVKNKINKYNKEIEKIILLEPCELLLFTKFNNLFFYSRQRNEWLDESKYPSYNPTPFHGIEELFSDDCDDNEYVQFLFDFIKEFEDDIKEDLILQLEEIANEI